MVGKVKDIATSTAKAHVKKITRALDNTTRLLKRFIVADEGVIRILAVWIAHTYIWKHTQFTPYLNVWSAERESGKSTVLSWLKLLCKNSFLTSGATTPAIVRSVDTLEPTLLYDEADVNIVSKNPTPEQKELIAFLNSGFESSGVTLKVNKNTLKPETFVSFCPKAFASIGADVFPDTTRSRTIHLPMYRKIASEKVERNTKRNQDKYLAERNEIIKDLTEWAEETNCYEEVVDLPDQLTDRGMDIYEVLFQIVTEAGEEWLNNFTESAIHLSGRKDTAIETGTQLLIDIHLHIEKNDLQPTDLMNTTDLISALCEFEESPWSNYTRKGMITAKALAGLLRRYRIKSQRNNSERGYIVGDFKEAIERFAKEHLTPEQSVTSVTLNKNNVTDVTDKKDHDTIRINEK